MLVNKRLSAPDYRPQTLASMMAMSLKLHPLAQGHLQGAVVDPAPDGSEAWDGFPPHFEIQEVLEDVIHHGDKVKAAVIDNAQFPPWCRGLLPPTGMSPSAGDEQENDAADDELSHGVSV